MIDLYFDNDCLSAFLWVSREDILIDLFSGHMVIPRHVLDELSQPPVLHLKQKVDRLIQANHCRVATFNVGSNEHLLYTTLTTKPEGGKRPIGNGEAAAIVLVKQHHGILASNNLKDITDYVAEFHLQHMTTAEILLRAYEKSIINENGGNIIWQQMLNKKRKLPNATFSDFIQTKVVAV